MKKSYLIKYSLALSLVAYIFVMSFGLVLIMQHHNRGTGFTCPITAEVGTCHQSATDHVAKWQNLFTNALTTNLIIIAGIGFIAIPIFLSKILPTSPPNILSRLFYRQRFKLRTLDYLLNAFSAGLLHPKLYA